MANNDTLLGYLAPRIAGGTENAAVEALGYILNRSPASLKMLNDLVQTIVATPMEPVTRVETQVVAPDRSRPDFVGFDRNGYKRVIGEAKFWAGLGQGQASAYLEQLADEGPSVLLFVAPDVRIDALWAAIKAEIERDTDTEIGPDVHDGRRRNAAVVNTKKSLILVSWIDLLNGMVGSTAGEPEILADIRQLQGLARREDTEAFMPIRLEELGPALARRIRGLNQLIDDAVDARGAKENWMHISGFRATPQRYGYGRYFRFSSGDSAEYHWFGVNCELWATKEDTPLWLSLTRDTANKTRDRLKLQLYDEWNGIWAPIHLKTGVEYDDVLNDIVSQLKTIAELIRAAG